MRSVIEEAAGAVSSLPGECLIVEFGFPNQPAGSGGP
jgi:hypothetical protein